MKPFHIDLLRSDPSVQDYYLSFMILNSNKIKDPERGTLLGIGAGGSVAQSSEYSAHRSVTIGPFVTSHRPKAF